MSSTSLLPGFDPVVPARNRLLDPASIVADLRILLGHEIDDARLRRSKYRLGESLRVVYELTTPHGRRIVAGRTFTGENLDAAAAKATRTGGVVDLTNRAVWWVFPNDRRLVGLASYLQPTAELAGSFGLPGWVRSTVAEYAPERSATLRLESDEGDAVGYLKLYAPGTTNVKQLASRYDRVARHLSASADDLAGPRALGFDTQRDVLLLEAMPGRQWGDLTSSAASSAPAALERLGRAIAHLHEHEPSADLPAFGRLSPQRLQRSAELVAEARIDVAAPILALAEALGVTRPAQLDVCFLHGDCHPKNALASPDLLSLIDLDQGGVGPAAADVGSLLARLRYGTLAGEHSAASETDLVASFLRGYAGVRTLPSDAELAWFTAAALVAERCIRGVNRLQRDTLDRLHLVIEAADALLHDSKQLTGTRK